MKYTKKQIEKIKSKYVELKNMISSLDSEYERHFTLDGHLIGSIGEVLASYYYGIDLETASNKIHDGEVDGKKVQIKITQRKSIVIKDKPDYLLVLFLKENGDIQEVFNGPGQIAFEVASEEDSYNHKHIQISRLIEMSSWVKESKRIKQIHPVPIKKNKYHVLVEKAQNDICQRSDYNNGKIELDSCEIWENGNQINLWTYWQGYQLRDIGTKRIDILVVGQDWGNPFSDNNKALCKRIISIQNRDKNSTYIGDRNNSPTDQHLIELFRDAFGIDIKNTNHNCRLFFTNYSLGYRKEGSSETGEMTKTLLRKDKELFEELVSVLKPKIIVCLGQITYEIVTSKVTRDFVIQLKTGRPFEDKYKNTDIRVFGVAHCGARGYSNIGEKKKVLDSWKYIAEEYRKIKYK